MRGLSFSDILPYTLLESNTIKVKDPGTPPDVYGRSLKFNQRKTRKQKRQNPHKYNK